MNDCGDSTIQKDFKYKFFASEYEDEINKSEVYEGFFEGKTAPALFDEMIGIHTLSNGLTFQGIVAIGDGGGAMYYISYFDGKRIRVYVPTKGNLVNRDFKTIISQEYESEDADEEKIANKYFKAGHLYSSEGKVTSPTDVDPENTNFAASYIAKYYGLDPSIDWDDIDYEYELMQASSVDFNWEAMKEEIETHLAPL